MYFFIFNTILSIAQTFPFINIHTSTQTYTQTYLTLNFPNALGQSHLIRQLKCIQYCILDSLRILDRLS